MNHVIQEKGINFKDEHTKEVEKLFCDINGMHRDEFKNRFSDFKCMENVLISSETASQLMLICYLNLCSSKQLTCNVIHKISYLCLEGRLPVSSYFQL